MPEILGTSTQGAAVPCRAVVIWIDWYPYHLARFTGLQEAFGTDGSVVGLELVGGIGVHAGLRFREDIPSSLPVRTLLPESSWQNAGKLRLARLLWQELTRLNPEVVLVPGYYTLPAIAAALWARLHGRVSVLMTESTSGDHVRTPWKERLKGALIRLLFGWAVTGGKAHVRYLAELGFPAHRVAHFYNVVGNQVIERETSRLRTSSSSQEHGLPVSYFLYVGRLAPEKNVVGLLRAFLEYRRSGGTWDLVLAGDGPEADSLRRTVQESGLTGSVVFAGHKTAQQLMPYFSFASCFVLPSTREPWGLVVNEAMAASLPVIVSNRCGCAEDLVEPGRNGYIIDPSNESTLADALTSIASLSSGQRHSMGALARERIALYSPSGFGAEILRVANHGKQLCQPGLPHLPEGGTL